MSKISTEEKRELIVAFEEQQARKLARKIIDKPKPPLWMILIPIFFVFFASKMKDYKRGINTFCSNWMISRNMCIDAACHAAENNTEPDIKGIVSKVDDLPPEAVADYSKWITLLTGYYLQLLAADGKTIDELHRKHFNNKTNYLLTLKQINKAENNYHKTLLPAMPGDPEDLTETIDRINNWSQQLQQDQAELLFQ